MDKYPLATLLQAVMAAPLEQRDMAADMGRMFLETEYFGEPLRRVQEMNTHVSPVFTVTPLILLPFGKCPDIVVDTVRLLVEAGAEVERGNGGGDGWPLFQACQEGQDKLVRYYVEECSARVDWTSMKRFQAGLNAKRPESLREQLCRATEDGEPTEAASSTTTSVWIASQNGYPKVVAILLGSLAEEEEEEEGSSSSSSSSGNTRRALSNVPNAEGVSPLRIAAEMYHPEVVGVLASAGADLTLGVPVLYRVLRVAENGDDISDRFDPTEDFANHWSLDRALRSWNSLTCAHCNKAIVKRKKGAQGDGRSSRSGKCSKCRMAYFCDASCLKAHWPTHKLSCKSIAKGRQIWVEEVAKARTSKRECDGAAATTSTKDANPIVPSPAFADDDSTKQKKKKKKKKKKKRRRKKEIDDGPDHEGWESFSAIDQVTDNVNYNQETAVVWEYDKGTRGKPVWVRYPPRIEAQVEGLHEMVSMGCQCYMYRPGCGDDIDGNYEAPPLSPTPPPGVCTRRVNFARMIESDIYTGQSRSVRRTESEDSTEKKSEGCPTQ